MYTCNYLSNGSFSNKQQLDKLKTDGHDVEILLFMLCTGTSTYSEGSTSVLPACPILQDVLSTPKKL